MSETEKGQITGADFVNKIGSLAAGVFILYLMVSFNFIPEIFGCDLQYMLKNSYLAKHIVGLLTVFFFINVTTTSLPWHLGVKFGFSLMLYIIFMFSNKSMYFSQIGFVFVIFLSYIIQLVRDQLTKNRDENLELSPEEKDKITANVDKLGVVQVSIFGLGIALIIFGHLVYVGKKKLEFYNNFSYLNLFKGTKDGCAGKDARPYTIMESLNALFKSQKSIINDEKGKLQVYKNSGGLPVRSGLRLTQNSAEKAEILSRVLGQSGVTDNTPLIESVV